MAFQEKEKYIPPYMAPNPEYNLSWRIAGTFAQATLDDVYYEVQKKVKFHDIMEETTKILDKASSCS